MEDDVDLTGQPCDQVAVTDVALDELDDVVVGQVVPPARGEVVQNGDVRCPGADQLIDDVRSDRARPSGHQGASAFE
jgi:hypothetical protein